MREAGYLQVFELRQVRRRELVVVCLYYQHVRQLPQTGDICETIVTDILWVGQQVGGVLTPANEKLFLELTT